MEQEIKKKVLLAILIVISLLIIISVYGIFYVQKINDQHTTREHVLRTNKLFTDFLSKEMYVLASHIEYCKGDSIIKQTFENRNREKLYDYCLPLFEKMKSEFKITHFYFIDTNDTCFLRVDNFSKHSDVIDYFTFRESKRLMKSVSGIELGKFGTFTLQYVCPILKGHKLLGFIELGMDIEHITQDLKKVLDIDLAFTIDKKFINRKLWEEGLKMSNKKENWDKYSDFVVIDKTSNEKFDLEKLKNVPQSISFSKDDNRFTSGIIPLFDVSKRKVGEIILLLDSTKQHQDSTRLRIFFILITVSIGFGLLFFSHKYFSKIDQALAMSFVLIQKSELDFKERNEALMVSEKELRRTNEELLFLYEDIEKQKRKLERTHKDITSSIDYAKTIQDALLPSNELINSYLAEYFLLYKPKDIVSGDFYYVNQKNDNLILSVADCTGHGVPGGFMTVLGITYLHDIVTRRYISSANEVLEMLRLRIKSAFKSFGSENQNGMDIALCVINTQTGTLQYSGANNPLIIIRDSELMLLEPTKNPIGFYINEKKFVNHEIHLKDNDLIYMFSDGYQHQFGGRNNRKFSSQRLRDTLLKIHSYPLNQQKEILEHTLSGWQNTNSQIDDITVMGVKWKIVANFEI